MSVVLTIVVLCAIFVFGWILKVRFELNCLQKLYWANAQLLKAKRISNESFYGHSLKDDNHSPSVYFNYTRALNDLTSKIIFDFVAQHGEIPNQDELLQFAFYDYEKKILKARIRFFQRINSLMQHYLKVITEYENKLGII